MAVQIVAEVGINHSGSLETALDMVRRAKAAGADWVKFQKRTPRLCVPRHMWEKRRDTPWGEMDYISYKERMEFGKKEYDAIAVLCKKLDVGFLSSAWDIPSARFLMNYNPAYIKIPSAKLTDRVLLLFLHAHWVPTILSTGMSTMEEIEEAVGLLGPKVLMACTSTYPCPPEQLNLRTIQTYHSLWPDLEIGWSGHEVGLAPSLAAVALGAQWVERHVTLNRASPGTDQAASVEFPGFSRMVKDIRLIERSLGDGMKKMEAGEWEPMRRLRE